MCLTALLNVGAKISIKPSFMVFFLCAFSSSGFFGSSEQFGINCRLWLAGLERKERRVRSKPALRLKRLQYRIPHPLRR